MLRSTRFGVAGASLALAFRLVRSWASSLHNR